jgi:hypothetical protein
MVTPLRPLVALYVSTYTHLCLARQPLSHSQQPLVAAAVTKQRHTQRPPTLWQMPHRHHHTRHTPKCCEGGKGVAAGEPGMQEGCGGVDAGWW